MTQIIVPPDPSPAVPEPLDPFRYGWRYVQRTLPDGSVTLEEVPLTLEDVLYPQEGDVIPQNTRHEEECRYLSDLLHVRLAGNPRRQIFADCIIDWGMPGVGNHSPDISVFDDVERPLRHPIGTFRVKESGGRPILAMELVSPDTRSNDVERKLDDYHAVGIPLYVIVDQKRLDGPRELLGYRWQPRGYERIPLDEQGRLLLEPLGLLLALGETRIQCFDALTGEELGDYSQVTRALAAAAAAARTSEERAQQEAEARRLAEQLAQAEAEARRLAERRALEAEEQIRSLEADLRRMRGET